MEIQLLIEGAINTVVLQEGDRIAISPKYPTLGAQYTVDIVIIRQDAEFCGQCPDMGCPRPTIRVLTEGKESQILPDDSAWVVRNIKGELRLYSRASQPDAYV